ncbi:GapA-binding peptide SR1P [Neobacillus mesonae]|uniref:GapA-binding peptide SR1P n=1 Tax=Neobacillus mesonae TaxID=1193713 RepID=UPI00203A6473|nr:GapA-binding peptide SR1P [Neobacillus mesonae]MCM3569868.1 GapA-binding peptide SR1P [Neobacillus mesonae]
MPVSENSLALGSIICDKCGRLLDTFRSEKVGFYYSRCNEKKCIEQVSKLKN